MHAVAEDAFMVDRCPSVHDARLTELGLRANRGHGHHLRSRRQGRVRRNERTGMDGDNGRETGSGEATLNVQSRGAVVSSDGNDACFNIRMLGTPGRKGGPITHERHVGKRRCPPRIVIEAGDELEARLAKELAENLRLSLRTPTKNRSSCGHSGYV